MWSNIGCGGKHTHLKFPPVSTRETGGNSKWSCLLPQPIFDHILKMGESVTCQIKSFKNIWRFVRRNHYGTLLNQSCSYFILPIQFTSLTPHEMLFLICYLWVLVWAWSSEMTRIHFLYTPIPSISCPTGTTKPLWCITNQNTGQRCMRNFWDTLYFLLYITAM